ncbi:MAG: hypothetical protein WDW36_004433 [Sanguina aurantia]
MSALRGGSSFELPQQAGGYPHPPTNSEPRAHSSASTATSWFDRKLPRRIHLEPAPTHSIFQLPSPASHHHPAPRARTVRFRPGPVSEGLEQPPSPHTQPTPHSPMHDRPHPSTEETTRHTSQQRAVAEKSMAEDGSERSSSGSLTPRRGSPRDGTGGVPNASAAVDPKYADSKFEDSESTRSSPCPLLWSRQPWLLSMGLGEAHRSLPVSSLSLVGIPPKPEPWPLMRWLCRPFQRPRRSVVPELVKKRADHSLDPTMLDVLKTSTLDYLHTDRFGHLRPAHWRPEQGDIVRTPHQQRMHSVQTLMTEANSSAAAMVFSCVSIAVILISTAAFVFESVETYNSDPDAAQVFAWIDLLSVQMFAADYIIRLISCPQLWPFLISPFNIIDLVSILPWFIALALQNSSFHGTAVFRILRLFRVFRVFKLGGRYKKLMIVAKALVKSEDMLLLMLFLSLFSTVLFSTLMYFAERGHMDPDLGYYVRPFENFFRDDGSPVESPYASIPESMWWCIQTLMTVGYGDVVPVTPRGQVHRGSHHGGRWVEAGPACAKYGPRIQVYRRPVPLVPLNLGGGVSLIHTHRPMLHPPPVGILSLALPISVVGSNFSNEWNRYKRKLAMASDLAKLGSSCGALTDMGRQFTLHCKNMEDTLTLYSQAETALDERRAQLTEHVKERKRDMERDVARQRLRTQSAFQIRTQLPTSQRGSTNPPQRISPAAKPSSKPPLDRSLSKRHVSNSGLPRSSQVSLSSHTTNADPSAPLLPQLQSSYSAPMPRSQSSNAFPKRGDPVPERHSAPLRDTPTALPHNPSLQPLLEEVDMKIRLGQLLGQPVMSRYNGNLIDMVRLEGEMMEKTKFLMDILRMSHLMCGQNCTGDLKGLRVRYKELDYMQRTSDDMRTSMEEMADEIKEVEQSLADLTARYTTGDGLDAATDIDDPGPDDRYCNLTSQAASDPRKPAGWDPATGSGGQSLGMYGPLMASMPRGGAGSTSFRPGRRRLAGGDEGPACVHEHSWLSGGESAPDSDAGTETSDSLERGPGGGGGVSVPGGGLSAGSAVGNASGKRRVVLGRGEGNPSSQEAAGPSGGAGSSSMRRAGPGDWLGNGSMRRAGSGGGERGNVSGSSSVSDATLHEKGLSAGGVGVGRTSMRGSGGGAGEDGRGVVSASGVGFELGEGAEPSPSGQRASPDWKAAAAQAKLRCSNPGASEAGGDGGGRSVTGGRTSSSSSSSISSVGAGGSRLRLSIVMEHHAEDGEALVLLSPIEDTLPPMEHSGPRKIRSATAGEGQL